MQKFKCYIEKGLFHSFNLNLSAKDERSCSSMNGKLSGKRLSRQNTKEAHFESFRSENENEDEYAEFSYIYIYIYVYLYLFIFLFFFFFLNFMFIAWSWSAPVVVLYL